MSDSTCPRCGGSTVGLAVFKGAHRYYMDCISALKKAVSELEPRAAFGDQCMQDSFENAYVEQSVFQKEVQEKLHWMSVAAKALAKK